MGSLHQKYTCGKSKCLSVRGLVPYLCISFFSHFPCLLLRRKRIQQWLFIRTIRLSNSSCVFLLCPFPGPGFQGCCWVEQAQEQAAVHPHLAATPEFPLSRETRITPSIHPREGEIKSFLGIKSQLLLLPNNMHFPSENCPHKRFSDSLG